MAPLVALEPLTNAVLGLAAAVLLLAALLLVQRSVVHVAGARTSRREPVLARLVYDAVQASPVEPGRLTRLRRFDRSLVRSILLGLALDLTWGAMERRGAGAKAA